LGFTEEDVAKEEREKKIPDYQKKFEEVERLLSSVGLDLDCSCLVADFYLNERNSLCDCGSKVGSEKKVDYEHKSTPLLPPGSNLLLPSPESSLP
jgi:hypothetical protein